MKAPGPHDSLVPTDQDHVRVATRSATTRRVLTAALALLVLVALLGLLGVRTTTTAASDGATDVVVEYAKVHRAGLSAPLNVTVHREGGFGGPVEVRVTGDYLQHFDQHGVDPAADSATHDGDLVTWRWDEVDGDTHFVQVDHQLQSDVHWRFRGVLEVRAGGDVAQVDLDTWVAP